MFISFGFVLYSFGKYVKILILGQPNVPIWQLSGNQGQQWQNGQAAIPAQSNSYKLIFEGRRGNGASGDIAIDDITFSDSICGGMKDK